MFVPPSESLIESPKQINDNSNMDILALNASISYLTLCLGDLFRHQTILNIDTESSLDRASHYYHKSLNLHFSSRAHNSLAVLNDTRCPNTVPHDLTGITFTEPQAEALAQSFLTHLDLEVMTLYHYIRAFNCNIMIDTTPDDVFVPFVAAKENIHSRLEIRRRLYAFCLRSTKGTETIPRF